MKKTGIADALPGSNSSGDAEHAPAEPVERARLQAEVAKQRVRIAKEELKRARKRVKEAKREAKRARKLAASARKIWKRARRDARVEGTANPPAKSARRTKPRAAGSRSQRTIQR
jgi:hypothetical protein